MNAPTSQPADPGGRADARRNRALVLAAAQHAFAERGTAVSLAEIARRAQVGAGTVHRHFPTKLDLLEAVMRQRIDRLTALALGYRDAPDAGAAFLAVCTAVVTGTPGNKALCEVFEADGWPRAMLQESGERFHHAVAALLAAAQREGTVRAELSHADVLAIVTGCIAIQRVSGSGRELSRPARLVLDAMRTDGSDPAVTKAGSRHDPHNESNETAMRCPVCGAALPTARLGRPARYCSPACRQKAHRRRHAGSSGHPQPATGRGAV